MRSFFIYGGVFINKSLWFNALISAGLIAISVFIINLVDLAEINMLTGFTSVLIFGCLCVYMVYRTKKVWIFPSVFLLLGSIGVLTGIISFYNQLTSSVGEPRTELDTILTLFAGAAIPVLTVFTAVASILALLAIFGLMILASVIAKKIFNKYAQNLNQQNTNII